MCDCRKNIEEKLLSGFKTQAPEATNHSVSLAGYVLIFGATLEEKGCMPIETSADFPLKKGGSKPKKSRTNMIFTYCPFCGVKYA